MKSKEVRCPVLEHLLELAKATIALPTCEGAAEGADAYLWIIPITLLISRQ
jgi:hypothetical protein